MAERGETRRRAAVTVESGDGAAIPLRGTRRDPDMLRRVLGQWLAARTGATGAVVVSRIATPGGTCVANETLLFDGAWHSHGVDHEEGFVVRLATDRPLYIEADIGRHAKIYEALADVPGVPVPRVYGYEDDADLLGAPFFVMERIDGLVPSDSPHWSTAGFVLDASPERRRAMWEDAVRTLAALHQAPPSLFDFMAASAGADGAPGAGRERSTGASHCASGLADHLAYWRRYLDHGYEPQGPTHEGLERGYEWLIQHAPDPAPTGFSWGDSRFANIIFRQDKVVALLDWDTASLAGPEADLAWWRYMDGPASALLEGIGDGDELVTRWQDHTGRQVQHLEWHDVFTAFRLAVVMLNLYKNMATEGLLAPEAALAQGHRSAPALALAAALDALS